MLETPGKASVLMPVKPLPDLFDEADVWSARTTGKPLDGPKTGYQLLASGKLAGAVELAAKCFLRSYDHRPSIRSAFLGVHELDEGSA